MQSAMNAENTAKDTMNKTHNAANETEDMRVTANKAGRNLRRMIDSASEDISTTTANLTASINENPMRASLIALGAGVVLSLLMRRR